MNGLVAVTGGTGFIGRHLVARLLRDGWRVRALTRRAAPELAAEGAETSAGSLEDEACLHRLVADADAVVHAAGAVTAPRREAFYTVNAGGTGRLVDAVRRSQARRFVLVSSLAAREPHLSDYAASKRRAEEIVVEGLSSMAPCVVRPPAVYGPGDRATLALFRQLARGVAVVPAGDRRFSLLYVADLADAIARLLARPAPGRLEIDDGRPGGYTWPDVAEIAARVLDRPVRRLPVHRAMLVVPARVNEAWGRLTGTPRLLTPGKLRELFHSDWVCRPQAGQVPGDQTPRVGFDEGFARTHAWYRRQGWL